jgi:large subunit ribosomal protein L14
MLHSFTWFNVADNSGALLAKCIRIYKKGRTEFGVLGDLVSIVIKDSIAPNKKKQKIRPGTIFKGLIIRQKSRLFRSTGQWRAYNDNSVILFGTGPAYVKANVYNPLSKRVYGPTCIELRSKGFGKVVALSRRVT